MSNTKSSGGVGCLTVLGLIFIVLKLIGTITWSWWLVLAPFLIQIGIVALAIVALVLIYWSERE